MIRLYAPLALLLFVASACDTAPAAHASSGAAQIDPFELRDDLVVTAGDGIVRLRVGDAEVELKAAEMFLLTQVAGRAAYDQFTDEQRALYALGTPVYGGTFAGDPPRCSVRPTGKGQSASTSEVVFSQPFMLRPPTGGGKNPCPPPPVMELGPELAHGLFGDYVDVDELPPAFDARPAAGGFTISF